MKTSARLPLKLRHFVSGAALLLAAASITLSVGSIISTPVHAADLRYVVNNQAITNYDIERRVALLRLMNRNGNLREIASQEMIDQTVRLQEIARMRIPLTDDMVNQSYANFASSNKLTTAQMDKILADAGVTKDHFKTFLRGQIGWGRVLQSRGRGGQKLTEQDVVARILKEGGKKPSTTEYQLQQVIFVIPAAQRGKLIGKRKSDAQAMKNRMSGCDSTHALAKAQIDVTIRELGKFLEPQLPSDWKDMIIKTRSGSTTAIRETERGVEFLAVCNTRTVSDDYVAQLVFQSEQTADTSGDKLSQELTAELRKKAKIVKR